MDYLFLCSQPNPRTVRMLKDVDSSVSTVILFIPSFAYSVRSTPLVVDRAS